jgi:hypothetical protein
MDFVSTAALRLQGFPASEGHPDALFEVQIGCSF